MELRNFVWIVLSVLSLDSVSGEQTDIQYPVAYDPDYEDYYEDYDDEPHEICTQSAELMFMVATHVDSVHRRNVTMTLDNLHRYFALMDDSHGFQNVNKELFKRFWEGCTQMFDEDIEGVFTVLAEQDRDNSTITPADIDILWKEIINPEGKTNIDYNQYYALWDKLIFPAMVYYGCPDPAKRHMTDPICQHFVRGGF